MHMHENIPSAELPSWHFKRSVSFFPAVQLNFILPFLLRLWKSLNARFAKNGRFWNRTLNKQKKKERKKNYLVSTLAMHNPHLHTQETCKPKLHEIQEIGLSIAYKPIYRPDYTECFFFNSSLGSLIRQISIKLMHPISLGKSSD